MPPQELPPVQEPDLPPKGPNELPPDLPLWNHLAGLWFFVARRHENGPAAEVSSHAKEKAMIRPAPAIAATTLGIALIVSNPAAAQMFGGVGIDIGAPYPGYYSRVYGYPYGYASYPYHSAYSYPYGYASHPYYYAGNNGWAGFFGGMGSMAAAPVEVAGTAVTAPFAVAAKTRAPVTTGRSVATAQPYYGTRPSRSYRHAYSGARRMHYGRSAVSGYPMHHGRSAYTPGMMR